MSEREGENLKRFEQRMLGEKRLGSRLFIPKKTWWGIERERENTIECLILKLETSCDISR